MTETTNEYAKRIDRVIDYLREHLHESKSLEDLARVACFSQFHFHRIFGAVTGETINHFTNRLRLEKSARLLRYSTSLSITDIALECGFSSSSALSRSFRNYYGTTPRDYRLSGEIKNSKICQELFPEHAYVLDMTDDAKKQAFPVKIKRLPAWEVAYIRVINSYEGTRVIDAFRKLIDWAHQIGVLESGELFGMSIDDPTVTPKHLYRYEACLACAQPFDTPTGISRMTMPSRTYATTRVTGDLRLVATAIDYLFSDWLLTSKYEPDHAPGLEIFLNKEKALDWSHFELELCIPIVPLNHIN